MIRRTLERDLEALLHRDPSRLASGLMADRHRLQDGARAKLVHFLIGGRRRGLCAPALDREAAVRVVDHDLGDLAADSEQRWRGVLRVLGIRNRNHAPVAQHRQRKRSQDVGLRLETTVADLEEHDQRQSQDEPGNATGSDDAQALSPVVGLLWKRGRIEDPELLALLSLQETNAVTPPTTGTVDDDDDPDDERPDENEAPIRETREKTEAPEEFERDDEDD